MSFLDAHLFLRDALLILFSITIMVLSFFVKSTFRNASYIYADLADDRVVLF